MIVPTAERALAIERAARLRVAVRAARFAGIVAVEGASILARNVRVIVTWGMFAVFAFAIGRATRG